MPMIHFQRGIAAAVIIIIFFNIEVLILENKFDYKVYNLHLHLRLTDAHTTVRQVLLVLTGLNCTPLGFNNSKVFMHQNLFQAKYITNLQTIVGNKGS